MSRRSPVRTGLTRRARTTTGKEVPMSTKQEDGASRRDFLKLAGTAAPAALAAATLGGQAEAAELPVDETRLQDTAHTRAYFESARF